MWRYVVVRVSEVFYIFRAAGVDGNTVPDAAGMVEIGVQEGVAGWNQLKVTFVSIEKSPSL